MTGHSQIDKLFEPIDSNNTVYNDDAIHTTIEPKNKFEKLIQKIEQKNIDSVESKFLVELVKQLQNSDSILNSLLDDKSKLDILNGLFKKINSFPDAEKKEYWWQQLAIKQQLEIQALEEKKKLQESKQMELTKEILDAFEDKITKSYLETKYDLDAQD